MVSMSTAARWLLLGGACVLVGVAAASGQAPPEQRVDIDELKAAIDAGATAASKVGELLGVHIIARPHDELMQVLPSTRKATAK